VILHRGQKGFGFVLRGAKSDSPLMELQPSERFPALQYLDDVDVNGVADRAGLRKGDFILAVCPAFQFRWWPDSTFFVFLLYTYFFLDKWG